MRSTTRAPEPARASLRPGIERVPYDPRRLEALVAYAEAHRPSRYVHPPVRRLLESLTSPAGILDLRVGGRPVCVAAAVDRCDNVRDAAVLELLGVDKRVGLGGIVAAALPPAREAARAAGRSAVTFALPERLVDDAVLTALDGWTPVEGSYVLERAVAPWPSPPLPAGATWEDLDATGVVAHHALVRRAFADDPGMMIPDLATFVPAALAADPPVRVLRRDGVELGFARVTVEEGGRLGYVATIGRDPAVRGQGLGPVLLAEALRVLASRRVARYRLGVTATNEAALGLYVRAGFTVVEAWRGWLLPVTPTGRA